MNIQKVSDQELVTQLKVEVQKERDQTSIVLRYLREVENRRLFLDRGYSSLFAFCTEFLAYSESEAYTRIQAMRLTKAVPSIEKSIETGALSLSVAAQAQSVFKRMEKQKQNLPVHKKQEVVESLINTSTREAERKLASIFPSALPIERKRAISEQETRIEFTADQALLSKLEQIKNLLGHKQAHTYAELFNEMATMVLAKLEKKNTSKTVAPLGAPKVQEKRYIPQNIRAEVWKRDQGQCQFSDPHTGKKCQSRHAVEFDHIKEFSKGGEHTSANLRLLCSAHNKWREWRKVRLKAASS